MPRKASRKKPTIVVDTAPDLLASAIVDVADAAKRLSSGPLGDKALLLLLSQSSGVSQRNCKRVLTAAANLKMYLRKLPAG